MHAPLCPAAPPSSPAAPAASAAPWPPGWPPTVPTSWSSTATRPAAKEVAAEVGGEHLVADLARPRRRSTRSASARRHVDILVNNAGIQHVAPVEEFDPEHLRAHPPGDAAGAVPAGPRAAPRHVRPPAGAGSSTSPRVHGHRASPYKSAYVSAKHGLEGLSKVIALEARRQGRHQQHRLPGLRPHPARRGTDRRPGRSPRHRRGRGARRRPARPHRRSSGSSSPTRWPAWSPSSAAPAPTRSPEPPI